MIAALIASIVANVALAYLLIRQTDAVRADARTADDQHRREVANLLQRIQAPDVAVQQHALETEEIVAPKPVSTFDDSDHWEAQGLTKERLAEIAMETELSGVA